MKHMCIVVIGLLFFVQSSYAVGGKLGIGMNAGGNYFVGDLPIEESLMSPNVGIYGIYQMSKKLGFKLQAGFGQFGVTGIQTSFIPVELIAMYSPMDWEKFKPFVQLGLGGMSFTIENSDRFNDGVAIGGVGFSMPFKSNLSFLMTGDFHYTSGDDFDGAVVGRGDSYFSMQAGVTFHLNKSRAKFKQENDDEMTEEKMIALIEENEAETFDDSYVIPELKTRINALRDQIAEKDAEIATLKDIRQSRDNRIVELESQLAQMEQQPQNQNSAPPITTYAANTDNSYSLGLSSETADDYMQALEAFNSKDYQSAIQQLTQLLEANPNSKMASNFYYWIGESHFSTKDYDAAIEAFKHVQDYQRSWKIDDSLLMLGRCYLKLGETDNAYQNFEQLLEKFPDSEFAEKAKFYLQ